MTLPVHLFENCFSGSLLGSAPRGLECRNGEIELPSWKIGNGCRSSFDIHEPCLPYHIVRMHPFCFYFSACFCIPEGPNRDSGHNWLSGGQIELSLLGWRLLRGSESWLHSSPWGWAVLAWWCTIPCATREINFCFLNCVKVPMELRPGGFG